MNKHILLCLSFILINGSLLFCQDANTTPQAPQQETTTSQQATGQESKGQESTKQESTKQESTKQESTGQMLPSPQANPQANTQIEQKTEPKESSQKSSSQVVPLMPGNHSSPNTTSPDATQETMQVEDAQKLGGKPKPKKEFIGDFTLQIPLGINFNFNYTGDFKSRLDIGINTGFEFLMNLRFLRSKQIAFWFLLGYIYNPYFVKKGNSSTYQSHSLSMGAGVNYFIGDLFFGFGFYGKYVAGTRIYGDEAKVMKDFKGFSPGGRLQIGYFIPLKKDFLYFPIYFSADFISGPAKRWSMDTALSLNFGLSFRIRKIKE